MLQVSCMANSPISNMYYRIKNKLFKCGWKDGQKVKEEYSFTCRTLFLPKDTVDLSINRVSHLNYINQN